MEKEAIATTVVTDGAIIAPVHADNQAAVVPPAVTAINKKSNGKIKKRGALHIIRVALFMLRRNTNKKSKSVQVEIASKGLWKRIVGAMRPLHHQQIHNQNSPPPSSIAMAATDDDDHPARDAKITLKAVDSFHDGVPPPMSPQSVIVLQNPSDSPSSSSTLSSMDSDDDTSRYASAQNLQELDKSEDCFEIVIGGEENGVVDGGDEMIDARAEEFIAQFYEQMRLQQLDLLRRYNEKRNKRALGGC